MGRAGSSSSLFVLKKRERSERELVAYTLTLSFALKGNKKEWEEKAGIYTWCSPISSPSSLSGKGRSSPFLFYFKDRREE